MIRTVTAVHGRYLVLIISLAAVTDVQTKSAWQQVVVSSTFFPVIYVFQLLHKENSVRICIWMCFYHRELFRVKLCVRFYAYATNRQ